MAPPQSAAASAGAQQSDQASLDGLPFEMQRLIMSHAPTLDVLSALVHASPELHRVYAQDRLHILRDFLQQSFGDMLLDAHAAYVSGAHVFQMNRDESMLWDFLNDYQQRRKTTPPAALAAQLSLEELIEIARFHTSIVEPLTDRYAIWALAALSSSPEARPLSEIERRRIQRGMYRLQIFCNVCGSRGEGRSVPNRIEDPVQRSRILSFFPAWQVEEILCVHAFGQDTYGGVFAQVAWDLNEERNPKYSHVDMNSVNEDLVLFSDRPEYSTQINEKPLHTMLRHGLTLLSAVFKPTNHDTLVELVRASIVAGMHVREFIFLRGWIDEAAWQDIQDTRREQWYSDDDAAQDSRQKITFEGDTPNAPPLTWVRFWKGEASNLFGSWVPNTFRRWGYIMWDSPRLDESGVEKYMELENRYWAWDPREEYYLEGSEDAY